MPTTMPTLTKMDCFGGESIWKEHLKDHKTRVDPITGVLYSAGEKCGNFSFKSWDGKQVSFDKSSFAKIAHLIEFGYINVKQGTEYFSGQSASVLAIYNPDWDMLLVKDNLFPVDQHDKSLVVHEAVHMINDRDKRTLTDIDNEAMAYIVQAMYYRNATSFQDGITGTAVGQNLTAAPTTGQGLGLSSASFFDRYKLDLAGNALANGNFMRAKASFRPSDATETFPQNYTGNLRAEDFPLASPSRFVDRTNRPLSIAFNFAFLTADALLIRWLNKEADQLVNYFALKLMESLLLTSEYKGAENTTATDNGIKDTKHWSE